MMSRSPKLCQHCGCRSISRPRRLCWACYYLAGVRESYPSTSVYARRGYGTGRMTSSTTTASTEYSPGTAEKLQVMSARAERGESLCHSGDRQIDAPFVGTPLQSHCRAA